MSIGIVLLLISALWMGVLAPSMKKLPTDFESEYVFEGDMTLLNANRLLSVSGTLDKNTAIDTYDDPSNVDGDGPTIVILIKSNPERSTEDEVYYTTTVEAYTDSSRDTVIVELVNSSAWLDRTEYTSRGENESSGNSEASTWTPENPPAESDFRFDIPFQGEPANEFKAKYVFQNIETKAGMETYHYIADERDVKIPYMSPNCEGLATLFDQFAEVALGENNTGTPSYTMAAVNYTGGSYCYLEYYEEVWVADSGSVIDRDYNISLVFVPDQELKEVFVLDDEMFSETEWVGVLAQLNTDTLEMENFFVEAAQRLEGISVDEGEPGDAEVLEANTYLNITSKMLIVNEEGMSDMEEIMNFQNLSVNQIEEVQEAIEEIKNSMTDGIELAVDEDGNLTDINYVSGTVWLDIVNHTNQEPIRDGITGQITGYEDRGGASFSEGVEMINYQFPNPLASDYLNNYIYQGILTVEDALLVPDLDGDNDTFEEERGDLTLYHFLVDAEDVYYGLMAENGFAPLLMPEIDYAWDSPLGKEYGDFVRWALPFENGETFANISVKRNIIDPAVIVPVLDDGEGPFDDAIYGYEYNQIIQLFFAEELLLLNVDWENEKFETSGETVFLPTFEQGETPLGEYHPLYLHYVETGLVLYGINPQPLFLRIDYDSTPVESMIPALDEDLCMSPLQGKPWYECIKYERESGGGFTTAPEQAAWGKIATNSWAFPICSSWLACFDDDEMVFHAIPMSENDSLIVKDESCTEDDEWKTCFPVPIYEEGFAPEMENAEIPELTEEEMPNIRYYNLDMTMDYKENRYVDPVTGNTIFQQYEITVYLHLPWEGMNSPNGDTLPESLIESLYINAGHNIEQIGNSMSSRWTTEMALTYFNKDEEEIGLKIMSLNGGYTEEQILSNAEGSQSTSSSLQLADIIIPGTLLTLASLSMASGLYIYYQVGGIEVPIETTGEKVKKSSKKIRKVIKKEKKKN